MSRRPVESAIKTMFYLTDGVFGNVSRTLTTRRLTSAPGSPQGRQRGPSCCRAYDLGRRRGRLVVGVLSLLPCLSSMDCCVPNYILVSSRFISDGPASLRPGSVSLLDQSRQCRSPSARQPCWSSSRSGHERTGMDLLFLVQGGLVEMRASNFAKVANGAAGSECRLSDSELWLFRSYCWLLVGTPQLPWSDSTLASCPWPERCLHSRRNRGTDSATDLLFE
jgi:hypothetical protein